MRSRVWAVTSLVLAVALAGCASDADADQGTEATSDAPQTGDGNETLPAELEYDPGYVGDDGGIISSDEVSLLCTTQAESVVELKDPTNQTFDGHAHAHDQWLGEDSAVIYDDRIEITTNNWFLMPGAAVYPGAGRAEFTLDWDITDYPGGRWLGVDFRDAPTPYAYGIDEYLYFSEPGETQSVAFNFTSSDPAHAVETDWVFRLDADTPARQPIHDSLPATSAHLVHDSPWARPSALRSYGIDQGAWQEASVKWEIFRTYDCLPVDPPHYDIWKGRDYMVLVDGTTEHDWLSTGVASSGAFYGLPYDLFTPNTTVAGGAALVRVTMDIDNQGTIPTDIVFDYVTAFEDGDRIGTEWFEPDPVVDTGDHRVYDLEVLPGQEDSPYRLSTLWDFAFYPKNAIDDSLGAYHFAGSIDWFIEVFHRDADIPPPA